MTWSYSPFKIATCPKDQVRLLIGDVLENHPQIQDEEISFLLTVRATIYGAAAECCLALAAKFSRSVDVQAGTSKFAYSQLAKAYTTKAAYFNAKAAAGGSALPYAGGISISDKQQQELNTDRVPPQFNIGMDDDYLPVAPAGNESEGEGSQ
jgi:hypothetical protein